MQNLIVDLRRHMASEDKLKLLEPLDRQVREILGIAHDEIIDLSRENGPNLTVLDLSGLVVVCPAVWREDPVWINLYRTCDKFRMENLPGQTSWFDPTFSEKERELLERFGLPMPIDDRIIDISVQEPGDQPVVQRGGLTVKAGV